MNKDTYLPEHIRTTAFFTGHRLLSQAETESVSLSVSECIMNAYFQGYRRFICGGALGFDTISALQVIKLKKKYPEMILSLAIPCPSQPDLWPENDRRIYLNILDHADEKTILFPAYERGVMLSRNRYMADRSSMCICYMKKAMGGTAYSVRYALQYPYMKIINLAVGMDCGKEQMREERWNYTYIFPSASENAVIVPLSLSPAKKLIMKNTSHSY